MISQKNRFRGHKSLDFVYKKGKTAREGPLTVKLLPSKREDYRLAVVVSKKVSKSAVKRNRIRRRLFEQFRLYRAKTGSPIKYDIIITVFQEDLATIPAGELSAIFDKLFKSAGIKT